MPAASAPKRFRLLQRRNLLLPETGVTPQQSAAPSPAGHGERVTAEIALAATLWLKQRARCPLPHSQDGCATARASLTTLSRDSGQLFKRGRKAAPPTS